MNQDVTLRRQWIATGVAVVASAAVIAIAATGARSEPTATPDQSTAVISVSDAACGSGAGARSTGPVTFTLRNESTWPTEVYLVKQPGLGTLFRSVILGPGSSLNERAVLGPGSYSFQCLQGGQVRSISVPFVVTGEGSSDDTPAIKQASSGELQQSNSLYLRYASQTLGTMAPQLRGLTAALAAGDLASARLYWLDARQTWAGLGAAYGSFGDAGGNIQGVRNPALAPANDPDFTGLGRIEYGLYHGESAQALNEVAVKLEKDVADLAGQLRTLPLVPGSLPLRAHEILEDTLRDTLSGQDDQGAGMAFAITSADVLATRATVADLAGPLESRRPGITATINATLNAVNTALAPLHRNNSWITLADATPSQRRSVNAAVSSALEALADVPQLLALPQGSE
ncbi:EfeM/EfeO family lipoprotein [Arthrobacter dokdonensis]|uniref:EfeM/EfeO family lipoprotein n=1 Tax=Arthrobacter dokdonellae TaxID=2211210 RepID=UPI000DE5AEC3|nr:EfeM/EfeO family lipoprotein [Arthrobacter dokdonellae]